MGVCSVRRPRHAIFISNPPKKMKVSTRNKAAGEANIIKGKTKAAAGKITRNPNLRARGRAQEVAGRIQKAVGASQKADGY